MDSEITISAGSAGEAVQATIDAAASMAVGDVVEMMGSPTITKAVVGDVLVTNVTVAWRIAKD